MDIEEARRIINEVDEQLVPLFIRRMKASEQIAAYKSKNGMPTRDMAREQEIMDRVSLGAEEALKPYVRELYGVLFSLSRRYQDQLRGAPPGPV